MPASRPIRSATRGWTCCHAEKISDTRESSSLSVYARTYCNTSAWVAKANRYCWLKKCVPNRTGAGAGVTADSASTMIPLLNSLSVIHHLWPEDHDSFNDWLCQQLAINAIG